MAEQLRPGRRYRIRPGYILREIAGEQVIVPVGAGDGSALENTMMAPNDTAVFLWKCFEQPSTLDEVLQRAMLEYEADESRLRASIGRFVAESLAYKVLEEVSD